MTKRKIPLTRLTPEDFAPFGTFTNMIDPSGVTTFGQPPIQFMPDMLGLDTGGQNPSFSICRVTSRPLVIDTTEFHSYCGETILPLDGDVYIQSARPRPIVHHHWTRSKYFSSAKAHWWYSTQASGTMRPYLPSATP